MFATGDWGIVAAEAAVAGRITPPPMTTAEATIVERRKPRLGRRLSTFSFIRSMTFSYSIGGLFGFRCLRCGPCFK
ncbi:hypothetical protein AV521_41180 [Streptomyces sp. IMTB 2501]|nr:hypothetical protein AV521_41180 [Streptomyces sp. IMTB 2501]